MHDPTDPIADRLVASDSKLKKQTRMVTDTDRRWCSGVLQETEITQVEGHAVFRSMLTRDTMERLAIDVTEHPAQPRDLLAPFRSYTVPRVFHDDHCATCDRLSATRYANMVAESLRYRLSTVDGVHGYVVIVDNRLSNEPSADTYYAGILENPDTGELDRPIFGTFVVRFEEADPC
jgi:hypothetical protein